jgi:adenylosuccinate synthase
VTSSNTVAGAAAAGAGLPPRALDRVVGITKAYTTRVGGGPFPTELTGPLGERLRADGEEFGATTGRPRRCGWFDAVVVRHAVALSGVDGLAITKADVLTGLDPLRVCVGYELDGRRIERPPVTANAWDRVRPVYEDLPGWTEPIGEVRDLDALPTNARRYLERLSVLVGAPMLIVSVGPGREQTMRLGAAV